MRYRNREHYSEAIRPVSLAGDYYFSIEMSDTDACWQTPIEIRVAVDGAVEGEPEYVDLEPEPTPEAEDEPTYGSDPADEQSTATDDAASSDPSTDDLALKAAVGTIGAGTVFLGVALLLFLRRRKRADPFRRW